MNELVESLTLALTHLEFQQHDIGEKHVQLLNPRRVARARPSAAMISNSRILNQKERLWVCS